MKYLLFFFALIIHSPTLNAVSLFKKSLPFATFIIQDYQSADIGIDAIPKNYLASYDSRIGTFSDLYIPFTVYTNTRSSYTKASDHYSLELIDSSHWCEGRKLTANNSVSKGYDVKLSIDGLDFDNNSSIHDQFTNNGSEHSSNDYSLVVQFPPIPQLSDQFQLCHGRIALSVAANI